MKKLLIAILFILLLFGAAHATTTDAERRQGEAAITQEAVQDTAALQKSAKELAQIFGVDGPKKAEEPKTEKNMAAVMDKAIDKVSDVVGAMAKAINNIAPEVWRIMVKQQYAKAVGYVVVPFLALLLFIGGFFAARARRNYLLALAKGDTDQKIQNLEPIAKDETDLFWWFKLVASGLIGWSCLWLANRIADAALFLINPEFYAIQDLLRMILNKGM